MYQTPAEATPHPAAAQDAFLVSHMCPLLPCTQLTCGHQQRQPVHCGTEISPLQAQEPATDGQRGPSSFPLGDVSVKHAIDAPEASHGPESPLHSELPPGMGVNAQANAETGANGATQVCFHPFPASTFFCKLSCH